MISIILTILKSSLIRNIFYAIISDLSVVGKDFAKKVFSYVEEAASLPEGSDKKAYVEEKIKAEFPEVKQRIINIFIEIGCSLLDKV